MSLGKTITLKHKHLSIQLTHSITNSTIPVLFHIPEHTARDTNAAQSAKGKPGFILHIQLSDYQWTSLNCQQKLQKL